MGGLVGSGVQGDLSYGIFTDEGGVMKIEKLLPLTQNGLRRWANDVHGDEMLFDANASASEFWAWIWFELRESDDNPGWFPSGKWATLQRIESVLVDEAKAAMLAAGGAR